MDNKTITYRWIKNPLIDPEYKTKVRPYSAEYNDLYSLAYEYLLKHEKLDKVTIRNMLPKSHIMFNGKVDLLYYSLNRDDYADDEETIHGFVYEYSGISLFRNYDKVLNKFSKHLKVAEYSPLENSFLYGLFQRFVEMIITYLGDVDSLLTNPEFKDHGTVGNIIDTTTQLQFISNKLGTTHHLNKAFKSEAIEKAIEAKQKADEKNINFKFKNIRPILANTDDVFSSLIHLIEELYYIYNYNDYPEKTPIQDVGDVKKIADPLVTIFKKIDGKAKLHKYLYLDSQQLKTPSPTASRSSPSRTSPSSSRSSSSRSSSSSSSPSRMSPSTSPSSSRSSSSRSASLLKNIDKNTLKLYKELINLGLLDLMAKAKMNVNKTDSEFLTKDREFFKTNVLFANDRDVKKCNYNTDAITQDEFDDKTYPLAKLQLMYQLPTRDKAGNVIRTDCFYAPTFYNYVVSEVTRQTQRNKKPTILNPLTKEPISLNDIKRLTDIIRITNPTAANPLLTPFDKYLRLDAQKSADDRYYHINVVRPIAGTDVTICKVCVIPTTAQSAECIRLLTELFDKKLLLHKYIPPYFINYRQYIKIAEVYHYHQPSQWNGNTQAKFAEFIETLRHLLS